MAIEIVPKPKIKKVILTNIILYSLLVIFLALILSYFILYIYQKKLNQELSTITKALVRTETEKLLEDEMLTLQRKIRDFGDLLDARQSSLNVFDFLEKSTHPKVWFSDFDLNLEKNTLSLSGQSENAETMEQQLIIFKELENIQNLNLSGFSIGKDGKINFELQLTLDPKILK